jgi:hypothetical protein
MIHENRTVSRKTPRDGKLEISPSAAAVVAGFGTEFELETDGQAARGRLVGMPCTCSKATASGAHVHYFLESEPLKGLPPDAVVRVEIERSTKRVRVGLEASDKGSAARTAVTSDVKAAKPDMHGTGPAPEGHSR